MATGTRRFPRSLLWGGLGVLILLLGAGSALFYLNRSQDSGENGFSSVKRLVGLPSPMQGEGEETTAVRPIDESDAGDDPDRMDDGERAMAMGPRTYRVAEGENLWAIGRKGALVESPWDWRTIVEQNKDKIGYSQLNMDSGQWKVLVAAGRELTVQPPEPPDPNSEPNKKWALQLLATPERYLSRAMVIVKQLLADSYYAYLYRIDIEGTSFYRVRVGFYETPEEAAEAGAAIHARYTEQKIFPPNYVVFLPSFREMRGERLDFGVQLAKPFGIEFPTRDTWELARADLGAVSPMMDFAYIAEERDDELEKSIFRTRAGYFTSEAAAQGMIEEHRGANDGLWNEAQVFTLDSFSEAMPGQRVKSRAPRL